MDDVSIIGVDLAKNAFHVHGASKDGRQLFRKKLTRRQFPEFMARQQPCMVAMEACGSSNYWTRELTKMGHDVRLIAPIYVKPFLKRQKNDAADAEAIVEAAQRPSMRADFKCRVPGLNARSIHSPVTAWGSPPSSGIHIAARFQG